MDEIARGRATAVRRALRGFDRDADTDEVGGTSSDRVAVLERAGADNPANALVRVVPTHTGLSFQRLGNKLVALLRRSPGFLQIGRRIGSAEARRLIFRYIRQR
jgi:hypothetical protein